MRTRKTVIRVSSATAMVVGALLTQACAGPSASTSAGSTTPATTASEQATAQASAPEQVAATTKPPIAGSAPSATRKPATAKEDVFSGRRQVYLLPVNSEATVAVDRSNRLALSGAFDGRALFVLTPAGDDRYLIKTAKLRTGGEPSCVQAIGRTPAPVTVAACDAGKPEQLFRFRRTGTAEGKPKYTVYTGTDTYLVQDPDGELRPGGTGVVAAQIGEGTPDIDTPFFLPDRGAATLPALD